MTEIDLHVSVFPKIDFVHSLLRLTLQNYAAGHNTAVRGCISA
jgi:hypothetical protein